MLDQFRLFATDFEGTEWAGGWLVPRIEEASEAGTMVTGSISSLMARVSGDWVSPEAGVQFVSTKLSHADRAGSMLTVYTIANEEISRDWRVGRHTLELLDRAFNSNRTPRMICSGSPLIRRASSTIPFSKNWLGEPLRILMGQLHYPRLVARNFGDGSAFVSVRQSPRAFRNASIGSLLASELLPIHQVLLGALRCLIDAHCSRSKSRRAPELRSAPTDPFL